jgi:hypothetical protein
VETKQILFVAVLMLGLGVFIWFSRKVEGPLNVETGLPKSLKVSGLDAKLNIIEYGTLTRSQAETKMQECLSFADQFFEFGEEAMSKTQICFAYSNDHFLDVGFHANNEFHVRAGRAVTGTQFEAMTILDNYEDLSELIDKYYNHISDFQTLWQRDYKGDYIR